MKRFRIITSPKWLVEPRPGWPAPLYNLYFDSFLLICTSFVVRTRGIVCVVYLLFRLANYKTLVNGACSPGRTSD